MKIKTSEATLIQLNWLAAKCEGIVWEQGDLDAGEYGPGFAPATDWEQGGPIIEREKIAVRFEPECHWLFAPPEATWLANYNGVGEWHGPTPLIAAMRCYVASKLGDKVDVPEELL